MIIADANVPVVVDAGLAVPSEASQALEAGADCVLVNTAIAQAEDAALMGEGVQTRRPSRPQSLPSRPHPTPALRHRQQPHRGRRNPRGSVNLMPTIEIPTPCLCLVTDRRQHPHVPLEDIVDSAVSGGVDLVQLREKDLPAV